MFAKIILGLAIMTTGLSAGVLTLYAHTIMPGLKHTDDRTFVGAFQSIDRAIINPWFLICFFGAAVLSAMSVVLHLVGAGGGRSMLTVLTMLIAAVALSMLTIVITLVVNVPLNDAIKAAGDPASIDNLAAVRAQFNEARWATWNLIRTVASVASLGLLVAAALKRA